MALDIKEFINHTQTVINRSNTRWAIEFENAGYFSVILPVGELGNWQAAHSWCRAHFGEDHYAWTGNKFWFETSEHATLFALRWS